MLPQTLENRAALRTAIAATVAILLAFLLHLDKPYWSGMTVVILSNVFTGNILDKAIMRLLGTVIGAWMGYFLAAFIANSFFLYMLISFFLIAVSVYYYNFSKYAYAWLMEAISAFMVISELAINPNDAFFVAIWRPVDIGLGVLVSAASAFCLFPNAIGDNVVKEIQGIFEALDALLAKLGESFAENNNSLYLSIADDNLQLKKKIRASVAMIDFMRHEVGYSREKIDQFRFLLGSFISLTRSISYFLSSTGRYEPIENDFSQLPISPFFIVIREEFAIIKSAFFSPNAIPTLQASTVMANFDVVLARVATISPQKYNEYLAVAHFLRQINTCLINLRMLIITGKGSSNKKKSISTLQQLRNDPDIIIHSIKAGLTVILALAFWLLSNWPGGLSGIVSSLVLSVKRNLFEITNVGTHRFIGCFLGGGIFLFSVYYFSINLYLLVLIIFFTVWAFSFFSFKQTNYSYIGLQANIALIMAMAQAGGPTTNIAPPLERLGGIIIGIIATFLVANLLWRTDLLTMLLRQLGKLKHRLIDNCCELLLQDSKNWTFYDLTNSFWLCRGLLESLDKMPLSSSKKMQISHAKQTFETLVHWQVTINSAYENIDKEAAHQTAEQFGVDLTVLEKEVAALYEPENKILPLVVRQKLENNVSKLASGFGEEDLQVKGMENCVAYFHSLQQLTGFTTM